MLDPDPYGVFAILEKKLAFKLQPVEFERMQQRRRSCDVTMGELYDFLQSTDAAATTACVICDYDLRGHLDRERGKCPECGNPFDFSCCREERLWNALVSVTASEIEIPHSVITRDSFFFEDLVKPAEEEARRQGKRKPFWWIREAWRQWRGF